MGKFRTGENREQLTFLPRSVDEYVLEEDPVRFLDALVDELDLSVIEKSYSNLGGPAFSPRVLTKIILFGKMRGVRSCRELARATRENVKFMYLAGNEQPDFRTINLFRKRFCHELAGLLGQTVRIALSEGMLKLEHVAIDGTKLKGYASVRSYQDPEKLKVMLSELEEELRTSFERDVREDGTDDDDEPTLPPELRQKGKLREKVQEALRSYESMKEKGKAPQKVSLTDPDCRYLSGGNAIRGYNMQAAVDAESRIVIAGYASNTSDNAALAPVIQEIEKNTNGLLPQEISADRAYCELKILRELEEKGVVAFVPQKKAASTNFSLKDFTYEGQTDSYRCPAGRRLTLLLTRESERQYRSLDCSACTLRAACFQKKTARHRTLTVSKYETDREKMIARTEGELGQQKKILRSSTIETLFGHLKHAKRLIQSHFRAKPMVDACWKLELASVNLEKIIRFRMAMPV